MSDNLDWNPETVAKLTELWNAGLSGNQIAACFGHVMTRQSVIGKARRLKLPDRSPNMNRYLSGSRTHPKPVAKKPAEDPAPEAARDKNGDRITVLNAKDSHCRYVYGEVYSDGSYFYCGAQVDRGSFCSAHRKICYTPATVHR